MKRTPQLFAITAIIIAFLLLVFVLADFFGENGATSDNKHFAASISQLRNTPVNLNDLDSAIVATRTMLNTLTGENGRFLYQQKIGIKESSTERYNILRHCQTLYALIDVQKISPDSTTLITVEKALRFLQSYIRLVPGQQNMAAIWTFTNPSNKNGNDIAKLGSSGLGLFAMASALRFELPVFTLNSAQQVAEFLRFMQKTDGSFYSKFRELDATRDDTWKSLFYPSEAVLGWLTLYDIDNGPRWIEYADNALRALATNRKDSLWVPVDHWALISLEKLFKVQPAMPDSVKKLHRNHAAQIINTILSAQRTGDTIQPVFFGSFDPLARTAPAAIYVEGLLAAINYVSSDQIALRTRMINAIEWGIGFLLRCQVKDGKNKGAITRSAGNLEGNTKEIKNFNERSSEVSVDYLQHALCAMIHFRQLKNQN